MNQGGKNNPGFVPDELFHNVDLGKSPKDVGKLTGVYSLDYGIPDKKKMPLSLPEQMTMTEEPKERATWGNGLEFLMSCIAMSIGLGNVWRFPFTAYENGGGAFLIPYIIVLFLVGKPFYYLEMIMGQFTSRSSVKMWACAPAFRGVGWAQMFSMIAVGTYYCSLMSVTLYYLIGSFQSQLPWSTCLLEWGDTCINSGKSDDILEVTSKNMSHMNNMRSSAELYFTDVIVVTTLDTLTSLMAGFTIFGILGNLAHELGTDDITKVVRGGTGLAFISYPDAIAKFTVLPQLFSVLFFLMLYVLGIGSAIAIAGGIISIINDQFPSWKYWHVVLATSVFGFLVGTVYCTPGGQFILGLVDYYAGSFIVFILATLEMIGIFWVYGLENFLDDVEFMLNRRPSIYWRICWGLITPLLLITILIYNIVTLTPLTYGGVLYPASAYAAGWTLLAFGVLQLPFWLIYTIITKRRSGMSKMIQEAFKPSKEWGPIKASDLASWRIFKDAKRQKREKRCASKIKQFLYVITGCEDRLI
ncbi:sodium-dependent nutrient amino acid transporter 1-like isoform X2 [Belonocnema kinseyi]|uniref:sodium-dependent nutrient amino acid transporter 1-like isoform X2 n=1 Tax=Belonocnema kinseyi TaxID=2817044 RepID=UPI00143DB8E9|nr:sodium-dependent nutrient amino acid transporter 1-like isoform X2 [Belonocnema kinseyi]